jgi:hypothetical protein
MAWRKKNTIRIAASCTVAAVVAICMADWAWGQGAGGGGGGSGGGVGASSGAAAGSSGIGATAGAALSPSAAGSQSQRNEPQSLSATDQPQLNAVQGAASQTESALRRSDSGLAGSRAFDQAGTQSENAAALRAGPAAQRRDTATGSITTDAIMQRRPTNMEQRTGARALNQRSPRGRAILGIDLDMRYPATAIVTKVYPGTGADEAGLRAGDVIVSIDAIPITSADEVIRVIADTNPDQAVRIGYMRRADATVHLRPRNSAAADSLSQHGLPPATPRPGSTATPQTQTGANGDPLPTDSLNREIEEQLKQLEASPKQP